MERLIANGGGAAWVKFGPGEKSARLNDAWNRLAGREREDHGDDDLEDWILDSAVRPLAHPSVAVVRNWRNKHVAHQDMRQMRMGFAGYEVFPIKPLVRAYWAVMTAANRVLLLADGSGLHGLYPTPQFSIAKELSGGRLDCEQTDIIDDRLTNHSQRWEILLRQSEDAWYLELNDSRKQNNPAK